LYYNGILICSKPWGKHWYRGKKKWVRELVYCEGQIKGKKSSKRESWE
jgi:hypothetical protein